MDILESSVIKDVEKEIITSSLKIENISGGLGINGVIRNVGVADISDITLNIDSTGGLLIKPKSKYYEIPLLHAGESTKIKIKIFGIGLGIITTIPEIKITVNSPYTNKNEIEIVAKILGPFAKIIGVFFNDNNSFDGYTLFSPEYSTNTYLINNSGEIVHMWEGSYIQGLGLNIMENGDLLRTALIFNPFFIAGGVTGRVEMFDWNGTLVWEFEYSNDQYCIHHDLEILPNGNILMIAWEYKTIEEAIDAGRNPDSIPTGKLWPDHIIEVEPTGSYGGNIVWEWHVWDHLVQDFDPEKDNYGIVEDYPELVDINFGIYTGKPGADLNHINSVDYNEEFDQILLSAHNQNEIWVIDHSTTVEEAAGHSGGNSGKGGDILYRWGNPQVYRAGNDSDQKLFGQHDAQWIEPGCPGNGNILIFNNGQGRPDGHYSSVDEIIPPVDSNGNYSYTPGSAYNPEEPIWIYTAKNPFDFYAGHISGSQRLPNGNTLICDGPNGVFFEVTEEKEIVWEYVNQFPNLVQNQVFNIYRYEPDYPGLNNLFI